MATPSELISTRATTCVYEYTLNLADYCKKSAFVDSSLLKVLVCGPSGARNS